MRRLAIVLWVLTLGACSSGNVNVAALLRGPRSVVVFHGMSPNSGGLVVALLAVAATRGDELRILDPSVDRPIASPSLAQPLSVPTMPGPVSLAAASLGDGLADVLLVASGGSIIQLFGSWLDGVTTGYGIVWTQDLATWNLGATLGAGIQILSVTGGGVPSGAPSGSPPVAPTTVGRARVFIGLSGGDDGLGGKLLVLDFARAGDGSVQLLTDPADPTNVLVLGFSPVGLSFSPDNIHLYAASREVIRGTDGRQVLGIAEVDTSAGTASTWSVRALDGLAPTTGVASVILAERTAGNPKSFGLPVLRVYAPIDPSGCGPHGPIACGIATYDPARTDLGLAADPSPGPSPVGFQVPRQPFQTPLFVPAIPFTLAAALPPASGTQQCTQSIDCDGFNGNGSPLMALSPLTGTRWTTATGAVAAGDGSVYLFDLGRWSSPDETFILSQADTRTQVLSAATFLPSNLTTGNYIGLYSTPGLTPDPPPSAIVTNASSLPAAFIVWPGFTTNDSWSIRWQGILPGMGLRRGSLGRRSTGELYLAVQQPVNPNGPPPQSAEDWIVGAFVDDAEIGIHAAADWGVGDLALYIPDVYPPVTCAGHEKPADPADPVAPYETSIDAILPRGADAASFPGGAMVLAVPAGSDIECLANQIPLGTSVQVTLSVRTSGLVLAGSDAGYAGRPEFGKRFDLAWQVEDGLTGEALVLARKARRFYYPGGPYAGVSNGGPCPGDVTCYPGFPEMTDPMQSGPLIGFRPGLSCPGVCPPGATPPRDATMTFNTTSGVIPMSRRASSIAVGTWVTTLDKSIYPDQEFLGRVFYTTFIGDALMMLPPGQAFNQTRIIR